VLIWIIFGIIIRIAAFLAFGYPRVNIPRKASIEGIENPEMVEAYNRINKWPPFKFFRKMVVREVKANNPKGKVVDIGCGPGYLINAIAKALPCLHIIGVDISEEMLKVARSKSSSLDLNKRVEYRQGDIQELPFNDNTIDFVISTFSLHHWSDPSEALQEIYRVLEHKGQFIIFDLRRDSRRLFYWLIRFVTKFIVPVPIRNIGEPLGSALSSYTLAEADAILRYSPFQQWKIKSGIGWMFVWGCKD
jgi:ubiquinone/menaquinone biosynthesis C-methylase UbiE